MILQEYKSKIVVLQGGEDDGADFAQYFPSFLWLVRDFTLQLVTPDGQVPTHSL